MDIVLILFTLVLSIRADNLYSLISSKKNYSRFFQILLSEEQEWRREDLKSTPCTVFVPIDNAFPKEFNVKTQLFIDTHIDRTVENTLERMIAKEHIPKVIDLWFSLIIENGIKTYYVNNAKVLDFITLSVSSFHQYMYPIDMPLIYDENRHIFTSLYEFIKSRAINGKTSVNINWKTSVAKEFSEAIESNGLQDIFKSCLKCTFFLFETIPSNENITDLVISAHVIKDQVLFTRTMSSEIYYETKADNNQNRITITKEDRIDEKGNNYALILAHNSGTANENRGITQAKITQPDIPLSNGVVHFISHPLTLVTSNIDEILHEEKVDILKRFMTVVSNSSYLSTIVNKELRKKNWTIFAFTNEAYDLVQERFPKVDSPEFLKIMRLHFVPELVLTTFKINENLVVHSYEDKQNISLAIYNKKLYVDAGGVTAITVKQDILGKLGVIHIVNKVLGIPTSLMIDRLNEDPRFTITSKVAKKWAERLAIKEENSTFLAPSNTAWEKLRTRSPSLYKQITKNMYPKNTEIILNRHLIIDGIITFNDLMMLAKNEGVIKTASSSVLTVVRRKIFGQDNIVLKWLNLEIMITRRDIQAVNGIIHEIDNILMVESDMKVSDEEARKSSGNMIQGLMWLTITLFTCLFVIA